MKTSNKILAGFLIVIFLIPVFILMSFNSKIKKGRFTVVKNQNNWSNGHKASISPYKVVKITGPAIPGVLSCNIIPADSASYEDYNSDEQDSIQVRQQGDTLFVSYKGIVESSNTNSYSHLSIDLYLPFMNNIIVDGADVKLDSVSGTANPEIFFQLSNQATLKLAEGDRKTAVRSGTTNKDIVTQSSGMLNSIKVQTDNANIIVGPMAWIKNLELLLKGTSKISVDNNSRIDQLSGAISDSSTVSGNWKNLKRLSSLAKE